MRAGVSVAALVAVVAAACGRAAPSGPSADERAAIELDAANAVVKTGAIGSTDRAPGTYALLDAKNRSGQDRLVLLEAELVDAGGKPLAPLAASELRIPAGETRTFALVASQPVAEARGVKATLRAARAVDYPPQLVVENPGFARVQEYTVATGVAKNVVERAETATLCATFYDAAGKILARPATIIDLPAGAARPLRFEGPKEAARAVVFAAEVVFPQ